MEQRTFDELISDFNSTISKWEIDLKYKFKLLGMIASIGYEHEKMLNNLPSAEQKTGEWILAFDGYENTWVCSECGAEYVLYDGTISEQHYCPNCGAKMGGSEKE